jgi:hypothetical protein
MGVTAPDFQPYIADLTTIIGAVLLFGAAWYGFKKLKSAL